MMKTLSLGLLAMLLASCSQADDEASAGSDVAKAPEVLATEAPPAMTYDGPIPMPIRVGGDGQQADACTAAAQVANLDRENSTYASVRDAPSDETKERDRLDAGQIVTVCASEGDWTGVVYSKNGEPEQDCGLSTPLATEQNYIGPCSQGWAQSRYLTMLAG